MAWRDWLPGARVRRLEAELTRLREMYAAAKTSRLTGDWSPLNSDVNDVIGASSAQVRARVRQLVRDFPYFSRAAETLTAYVVGGSGIRFQARIQSADGRLDRTRCRDVENLWRRWGDVADVTHQMPWPEIQQLAQRQLIECGEFLFVEQIGRRNEAGRIVPYALQAIEPDRLTCQSTPSRRSHEIVQGIELDNLGRPMAYHISTDDVRGGVQAVPADRVIHGFRTLRPGQVRGISPFTAGVLVARDLSDYLDAEIDAAKMAAKWLAFVTRSDLPMGGGFAGVKVEDGKVIEDLENAIIEYLRPGESVNIASNPRPGSSFTPFVRLVLCMFSVATGVPYELISGDYVGMNYSVSRMSRLDFQRHLSQHHEFLIRRLCRRVHRRWMDVAVLSGRLRLPGYEADPWPWLASAWHPPVIGSADPLKDAKAIQTDLENRITSPQRAAAERGHDYEEILAEIASARDMAEELGLSDPPAGGSTAIAGNPAALGAGELS